MDVSQISGTASSYARKYCLNGIFLIDDTKDADTDEYHEQTHKRPADSALKAKIKLAEIKDEERLLKEYGVEKLSDLTDEAANKLEDLLDTQIELKKRQKKAATENSETA